jgi:hypothetical protein
LNPLEAILQAAQGHQGLPPSVTMAPGAQPADMGGAQASPIGQPQGGSADDQQVAQQASEHLLAFAAHATDPALKALFSQCLAALHKYLAQGEKEHQQALQGKLSPKLMSRAHGA